MFADFAIFDCAEIHRHAGESFAGCELPPTGRLISSIQTDQLR